MTYLKGPVVLMDQLIHNLSYTTPVGSNYFGAHFLHRTKGIPAQLKKPEHDELSGIDRNCQALAASDQTVREYPQYFEGLRSLNLSIF